MFDDGDSSSTGPVVMYDGFYWCATMTRVYYTDPVNGFQDLIDPDTNQRPEGCVCLPENRHLIMVEELEGISPHAVITEDEGAFYREFRDEVWRAASAKCRDVASEHYAGYETECDNYGIFWSDFTTEGDPEPIYPIDRDPNDDEWDECVVPVMVEEPPQGSVCDFVDGDYDIDCDTFGTLHDCTVDEADIEAFFADPGCILVEGAMINLASSGPYWYRLDGINSGEFLYELGLRNGDRPYEINGYPLTSPEEAVEAWVDLRDDSSWELKVKRSGVTETFEIDRSN
jgi:hypothetical protein